MLPSMSQPVELGGIPIPSEVVRAIFASGSIELHASPWESQIFSSGIEDLPTSSRMEFCYTPQGMMILGGSGQWVPYHPTLAFGALTSGGIASGFIPSELVKRDVLFSGQVVEL